jgi:hypothetical protein
MVGDRWIADPNVSAVNVERNRKSEAWCVGEDRLIAPVPFSRDPPTLPPVFPSSPYGSL